MTDALRQVLAWVSMFRSKCRESCGLSLRIEPTTIVLRPSQKPKVTAHLTNNRMRPLTLVLPGEGSRMGRRTPIIEWVFTPGGRPKGFEGCGNINGLKRGEVFTLYSGGTRELEEWIQPLALPAHRRFRAVMIYTNDPNLPFRGVLLRPHDEGELARLRTSDGCWVRSNEIEIIVGGYSVT